ncbi:DNA repair protein RecO [Sphingosinicella terrae]|uniref:DNA repair protein RecO n=1 Tax=Sphingosinicella terrae TaxID=2172047 RepID=UPI000E0DECFC|nr:recombination protein O N-terminal domain-containing protein [Sphingosinicella terrae]
MQLTTRAIVLAVRAHGEHGAIVRALTPGEGVQPGYVRGGRSRRLKPILVPGNEVQADYRARTEDQLAHLSVELVHSRAFLFSEPLAAAGLEWACALTAAALPEGQPYPHVHEGLDGLLAAIEAAPSARGWSVALIRYELVVLAELGFGLGPERLATLPRTLTAGGTSDWAAIHTGLGVTGNLLARDLLTDRRGEVLAARERLVERLKRVGG